MDLVCPTCQTALLREDASLRCATCGTLTDVEDGVPVFVDSPEYWGEDGIPRERAREIVARMATQSWRTVLSEHEAPEVRRHYPFIANLERASWYKQLTLPRDSTVLDIGAGLGTMSFALSQYFSNVYSVERVRERVDFMRLRFRQEGARISLIRSDLEHLPFPEKSFDLIVLNGVLEWFPYSRKDMNPRDAQVLCLKILRRLLKPGGTLYIGIENRTSYDQFLGGADPHTGIPFTGVLPRRLADVVSWAKTGDRYRAYLYSHVGYRKLIRQAGFSDVTIFAALPSYNDPKYLLNLDRPSSDFFEHVWKSRNKVSLALKRVFSKADVLKYMGYAYIMFATNAPAEPPPK